MTIFKGQNYSEENAEDLSERRDERATDLSTQEIIRVRLGKIGAFGFDHGGDFSRF